MGRTDGPRAGGRFPVTPGMRRLGASVLGMEAVVLALSVPVAIAVAGVTPPLAVATGLGLAVACVVVTALLKRPAAYVAGSVIQVLAIAMGFLVPMMFLLGVIFLALWVTAIIVARRVEGVTSR